MAADAAEWGVSGGGCLFLYLSFLMSVHMASPHPPSPPILMLTSTYVLGSKDSKPTYSCPHFNEYAFNMFLLNVNFDKSITE